MRMLKAIAIAAFLMVPTFAFCGIYGYVDAEGVYHMTNIRPAQKSYFTLIEDKNSKLENQRFPFKAMVDKNAYDGLINQHSAAHGVDPHLVKAVMLAESNGNPLALSHKGAQGLMQIMPETGNYLELKNPFDPDENIQAGTKYLKMLHELFKGNIELVLAAYNAGPQRVVQYNMAIPPYNETVSYVKRVKQYYERLKELQ
jgi:soluble lytic murein transglycosylase-like protein